MLVAHPSPDLYGSDLQLLETVSGFVDRGWRTVVALPERGPLAPLLRERGAEVLLAPFPTVSRSLLRPRAFARFAIETIRAWRGARQLLGVLKPKAVWVNTVTAPVWLVAAWSCRVPSVVHVHEAEEDGSRLVRTALTLPTALARRAVVNSRAAARALVQVLPLLEPRLVLVYNGVPEPETEPLPRGRRDGVVHVALVGRLSPRKGTDIALDAIALLRTSGVDVHLDLYGAVFPGYEWYEADLRERAARADLDGAVTFHGYVRPVWTSLAAADIVVVPSRTEPFGNVAVEAQLAHRPVVVAAIQGLTEIVTDEVDGLHAEAGSAPALARAVRRIVENHELADRLAGAGRASAVERFSVSRYRAEVADVLASLS
ncbi:glycosyltransferase family 4 protein [Miniimonas sp. S16]|uniref:glycosyltransferase family 4 protein n=1 Tax=Miniimonas sp. S16 TaxID=2171623 RepID=UPI001F23F6BE|nr:glycosyltransferase family 4 protein [Miniimonas sp. S16]